MTGLAADIGGTYSRLAWRDDRDTTGYVEQHFNNSEFDCLEAVIDQGLALRGRVGVPVSEMVLAVPGPVHADPVALTNIAWQLRRDELKQRYGSERLLIVNDFQAAALGAIGEQRTGLKVLNDAPTGDGAVVVAGAGTGLGMAWLPRGDHPGLPIATEGGHLDFAPNSEREVALYRYLAGRFGHVSYERILSGDGLVDTYRFVSDGEGTAATPKAIATLAARGDDHATEAVDLFVTVFAAYAGNLALAFNPDGGIYLCGGLTAHLADRFEPDAFAAAYTAKGRMAEVVSRIPVFLVSRHDAGLAGAKRILEKLSTGQRHDKQ